jgi:hypothetical protein
MEEWHSEWKKISDIMKWIEHVNIDILFSEVS